MKVIYTKPKNQRIKKGTTKIKGAGRISNFHSLEVISDDFHYSFDLKEWFTTDERNVENIGCSGCFNDNIKNLKQAIRHIKKIEKIPNGTKFKLESNFKGYDIYIIK